MPRCVIPPTDTGVVDVLHENQDMWIWGLLCVEDLISLIFLFRHPQRPPIESLVPALPLILIHKLSFSSSSIPCWSSMHSVVIEGIMTFSFPACLCHRVHIFPVQHSWVSVMPIRSEPCRQVQISSSSWLLPKLSALWLSVWSVWNSLVLWYFPLHLHNLSRL